MIHGRVLIEPDVHDKHSLVSQVLVSRPSSRTSRTSHHTDRTSSAASNKLSDKLRPSSRVSQLSQNHVRTPSGSSDKRNVLPEDESYRVVSELLPHSTQQIHEAILEAGRKISNSSSKSQSSCTCYQCQNSQKSSQNSLLEFGHKTPYTSLVPDINSNLIVAGSAVSSLTPTTSTSRSTAAARRHFRRATTHGRLLTQAELLKLGHFRRFLRSSGLSQLDFLLRIEQLRRSKEDEACQEVDEEGRPAFKTGGWREEGDQEFVALSAMLLCGELELRQDTFQAISTKPEVRERLYGLVSPDTDGLVTADQVVERVANTKAVGERNELAGENLRWLEKVFKGTVGDHGEITLNDFKTIVQSKNPFFVERVFQIFDKDDSGSISFQEFIDAMHQFAGQTPDDKIKFLFKVYDIDGDGLIQEAELQHVMRACMEENGMSFADESVEELTGALYQDAKANKQPGITFSSLKSQISAHEGLLENLTISIDRWLVPPKPKRITQAFRDAFSSIPRQWSFTYIRNNAQLIFFHIFFWTINLSLIVSRLVEYRNAINVDGSRNWSIMIARASGQCLNFSCMFVLLPMLRLSVTKLRQKGFNYLLPLDKHVSFHRLTGHLIAIYSIIHAIAHVMNLVINVLVDPVAFLVLNGISPPPHWGVNNSVSQQDQAGNVPSSPLVVSQDAPVGLYLASSVNVSYNIPTSYSAAEWLLTSTPGLFGLVSGWANPTGVILLLVLSVMVICSMKWVRKSGNFEIFYWTHFLYLLFWLLVILHAPNFWKWFIGPACLFVFEKVISIYKSHSKKGKSYVTTGVVLPSKVVNLVIKRPPNFTFKPGDYIYLNIPSIANFEWHPFTISSAPEETGTLSLHIRAVGHWTNSLYEYFEREQARLEGQTSPETKRSVLRQTLTAARERARKMSASVGGGGGVASSINMWGGAGQRRLSQGHNAQSNLRQIRKLQRSDAVIASGLAGGRVEDDDIGPPRVGGVAAREDDSLPANAKMVARSFRYMRRKPTIIAYKPPKETIVEEEEGDLCSSNHFILDRIAEKDSTDNLYRAGSESENDNDIDIRQVNKPLHVFIDGPFGAPTSQIFHAQHAVLIGTGIGVTPFASILQSIMHRYWAARNTCPKCTYRWTNDLRSSVMNLRKVDFFWINREQRSFEWFVSLLSQLEIEQAEQGGAMERFLDMHMYITSALQKTDMKAVGLQLALELLHEKSKRDLITGLKTRTIAGRPNWDKVFKKVSENKKGRVTVFFCGPPQLGKLLKLKCDEFGFDYRKENF